MLPYIGLPVPAEMTGKSIIVAVSYTHLDVYKRQSLEYLEGKELPGIAVIQNA